MARKRIILSDRPGQLGNLLFLYAHFIGFCLKNQVQLFNPAFSEYEHEFELNTGSEAVDRLLVNRTKFPYTFKVCNLIMKILRKTGWKTNSIGSFSIGNAEDYDLDSDTTILKSRNTFVAGWLYRGNSGVVAHKEVIGHMFTLSRANRSKLALYKERHFSSDRPNIGVHIRLGDYKEFEGGQYYFEIAEYVKVMERIAAYYKGMHLHFLVCSNENLTIDSFGGLHVSLGDGSPVIDMYALSECDLVIGPPSTFTMWGQFLKGVKLIQLKRDELRTFEQFLPTLNASPTE